MFKKFQIITLKVNFINVNKYKKYLELSRIIIF